jgi:hypothetical protein
MFSAYFGFMRKNLILSRELLLTAILFVSAAAIITGTILSMYTTTAALAAAKTTTTQEKTIANDNGNKPTSTSVINEKQKQELITAPSIPFTTPSPSTTAITPDLSGTSTIGTQALSSVKALQTNNLVNTQSYYDIIFKTGTTATIGKIDVTFPSGTSLSSKVTVEVSGIGSGGYTSSGNTITYTVSSPVSVSSGKTIRLEFGGIGNPSTASSSLTVSVTTKASDGTIIEGPATSAAYSIRQIGGSDIAGTSKLLFIHCTGSSSGSVNPGSFALIDCTNSSVAEDDAVLGALDSNSNFCFDLREAHPYTTGIARFVFVNECTSSQTLIQVTMSAIVFHPT